MTAILYSIIRPLKISMFQNINGMDGNPIRLITHKCQSAVYSLLKGDFPSLTIERIQTFHHVIEKASCYTTAIPIRMGSLFKNRQQIRAHMIQNQKRYERLMKRIEGCVEMAITLSVHLESEHTYPDQSPSIKKESLPVSGKNYLYHRKNYYHRTDRHKAAIDHLVLKYKEAYQGLFHQFTFEYPPFSTTPSPSLISHSGKLSLYFLVNKSNIEKFMGAGTRDSKNHASLSGPWPPYNFVYDQHSNEMADLLKI